MTLQEAKDKASSIVSPNSDLFQPIVYALLDAAGEPEEGATVCSHCGRAPNGDSYEKSFARLTHRKSATPTRWKHLGQYQG